MKRKIFAILTMTCILLCCVAVTVYAYQADYISGQLGFGVYGSGGLYMSTSDMSYSATADTSISSSAYPHTISVTVSISPNNSTEQPISAWDSSSADNIIQVSATAGTLSNASTAGGTHSASMVYENGVPFGWDGATSWAKSGN